MTPEDALAQGQDARLDMLAQLQARGVNPASCPRLLDALEHGVEQAAIAFQSGRDVTEYRQFVAAVYGALDATTIVDQPPMRPRRTLNPALLDPDWRPGPY